MLIMCTFVRTSRIYHFKLIGEYSSYRATCEHVVHYVRDSTGVRCNVCTLPDFLCRIILLFAGGNLSTA